MKWSIKPCIVITKKISKALRKETVDWIMKNSNVREAPITSDTLLIADADYKVKRRVTNDVIISDTILCSLAPPQLRPLRDNHKRMCGCAICNTYKYMQESLNAWRRKQLKFLKENADNSRGRVKVELSLSYNSDADYAFPDKQTRHPCCENAADSVLCTATNDECKFDNTTMNS